MYYDIVTLFNLVLELSPFIKQQAFLPMLTRKAFSLTISNNRRNLMLSEDVETNIGPSKLSKFILDIFQLNIGSSKRLV